MEGEKYIRNPGEWVAFMMTNNLKWDSDMQTFTEQKNIRDEGFYRWMTTFEL
jgi:hypothetical protein